MKTWDLDETKRHIRRLYGDEQLKLTISPLQSIGERQYYARFHFRHAEALLKTFLGLKEESGMFNTLMLEVGAHLTACIQSMHAVADILAHSVYYSLGENLQPNPLAHDKINLYSVANRMTSASELKKLEKLLGQIATGGEFRHLSALSNRAKHQGIVRPAFSFEPVMVLPRFTLRDRKGIEQTYQEVVATDFLKEECARCERLVLESGCELNAVLAGR